MQLCLNGAPNNVNKFSGTFAEKNINFSYKFHQQHWNKHRAPTFLIFRSTLLFPAKGALFYFSVGFIFLNSNL